MPSWNDALTATLDQRAKPIWTRIAPIVILLLAVQNSGLYLNYHQNDSEKRLLKPPIAAGKGSEIFSTISFQENPKNPYLSTACAQHWPLECPK